MSVDDGRYVYCVVPLDADAVDDGGDAVDGALSVSGVDDGDPYVVAYDGLGAVVQACDGPFESEDLGQLRRWLLQHQAVVDDAGEAFGTPIPFRFDTVVRGGDEAVEAWLDDRSETFRTVLDALAGHWEYRIEVTYDAEQLAEDVDDDPKLEELANQRDEADEGRAFLLGKKYDRRRDALVDERLDVHRAELTDELESLTAAMQTVEPSDGSAAFDDPTETDAPDDATEGASPTDTESVSLTVLASDENESAIGDLLETVADETGASVRFTGPWPPYSYAPTYLDAAAEQASDDPTEGQAPHDEELAGGNAADGGSGPDADPAQTGANPRHDE